MKLINCKMTTNVAIQDCKNFKSATKRIFYFILQIQLVRRFYSIIFRFAQLFFILLNHIIRLYYFFLFDVYYVFVSLFFVRNVLFHTSFTELFLAYVFDILFFTSLNFAF